MCRKTSIAVLGCALAVALALGGCREDEQGRALTFDKGNYSGKPDTPLSAEAREKLRDRARHQGGLGGVDRGPPGGAVPTGADVRPPAAAPGNASN